jgi:hypothetical protein
MHCRMLPLGFFISKLVELSLLIYLSPIYKREQDVLVQRNPNFNHYIKAIVIKISLSLFQARAIRSYPYSPSTLFNGL